MYKFAILVVVLLGTFVGSQGACNRSITRFGGTGALFEESINVCSGELIFEDNFDNLDEGRWYHELWHDSITNGEFQQYVNDRSVSYTYDGKLYIKPKIDGDFGAGTVPIKSARMNSNFHFTYGYAEINAKLPGGDWIWPAIWMMPQDSAYGQWPASGEMDIMESRGNDYIDAGGGANIGNVQMASTMHWGPDAAHNQFTRTSGTHNHNSRLSDEFHTYSLEWHPDFISFRIDGGEILRVTPPDGGFWELGELWNSGMNNPWGNSKMAPFDRDFHFILNVAVGGTAGFFPDGMGNKPWSDNSGNPSGDFWNARGAWEPTWQTGSDHSAMQIDYVRVWAL